MIHYSIGGKVCTAWTVNVVPVERPRWNGPGAVPPLLGPFHLHSYASTSCLAAACLDLPCYLY